MITALINGFMWPTVYILVRSSAIIVNDLLHTWIHSGIIIFYTFSEDSIFQLLCGIHYLVRHTNTSHHVRWSDITSSGYDQLWMQTYNFATWAVGLCWLRQHNFKHILSIISELKHASIIGKNYVVVTRKAANQHNLHS